MGKSKKEEKQAAAGTPEKNFIDVVELEDILNDAQAALGSLGIIESTMTELNNSGDFSGIEETTTRFTLYRLADLAVEALEKLEKVTNEIDHVIYPEHKVA